MASNAMAEIEDRMVRLCNRLCSVAGCGRPRKARGWCGTHWYRWRLHGDVAASKPVRTSENPVGRFWMLVEKGEGCWEWSGSRDVKGYGRLRMDVAGIKTYLAHRVSWLLSVGPIPSGRCVLHRCDNPPCVRPDHLFLGTLKDNNADMAAKGRHGRYKAKVTHCPKGHPYAGDNLVRTMGGWRRCRTCKNQALRDRRLRGKGIAR